MDRTVLSGVSLLINLPLLGLLLLGRRWWLGRQRRRGRLTGRRRWLSALAVAVLLAALNLDYRPETPAAADFAALELPEKEDLRRRVAAAGRELLGRAMLDGAHPDGLLCGDVAFQPLEAVLGIRGLLTDDYRALAAPAARYPAWYDRRRCPARRNLKFIWDRLTGQPRNEPDNPYFFRRINNLRAYLASRGLYYPAGAVAPRPGMIAFFQRGRDAAPTHVALVSAVGADGARVIQTSGSYDGDGDGRPDYRVVEVPLTYVTDRTSLVGFGDVPLANRGGNR